MRVNEATIEIWEQRIKEVSDEITAAIYVPNAPANMTFIKMDSVVRQLNEVLHRLRSVKLRLPDGI